MAGLRIYAKPLNLEPAQWPIGPWLATWVGPGHFGADRQAVQDQLEKTPGNHLVLVRYSPDHEPGDEWVYNGADIDGSRVIWAREMNPADNENLMRHYKDRDVYLVQPDLEKGRVTLEKGREASYPAAQGLAAVKPQPKPGSRAISEPRSRRPTLPTAVASGEIPGKTGE
jgi:hypothetical protein